MKGDVTKEFHAKLYADNLPNPIVVPLLLECESVMVIIENLENPSDLRKRLVSSSKKYPKILIERQG
jgi:hypothetical protein